MSREEYDFEKAKQGPVVKRSPGETRITIRLDTGILNWFREQVQKRGGGTYLPDPNKRSFTRIHKPQR